MSDRGLFFSPRSRRDLKALPARDQEMILTDLESLASAAALPPPPRVRKLHGLKSLYRLRSGDYRAVFRLASNGLYVLRIVARKETERALSGLWG